MGLVFNYYESGPAIVDLADNSYTMLGLPEGASILSESFKLRVRDGVAAGISTFNGISQDLVVYDVSDPDQPVPLRVEQRLGNAFDIETHAGRVFFATANNVEWWSSTESGTFSMLATKLRVRAGVLYGQTSTGFARVDLANDASLAEVPYSGDVLDFVPTDGGIALVDTDGLTIVDLSGNIIVPHVDLGFGVCVDSAQCLASDGRFVAVAARYAGAILVDGGS
jgi:hypothetical protein